ncbi:MAG: Asp-tRNA(Asn)/Glu-tRNA(Gln) amidotransferase subunit GatB [Nanoarchaeota archaeon]|nr:Asp-tRNA(Asn)/Glu-tRNA(Gln) amidotransferase subunit GatB [Nanoarchaeota archaeon]
MSNPEFKTNVVIGLEIHVELDTKTKIFCSCPTKGSEEPNTRTCPICLGMPGSKPVLNKLVLDYAAKLCMALNCEILPEVFFSRKTYFYPDMSKNYQITQYEVPIGVNGILKLKSGKEIKIRRIHMEEDPAALIHPSGISQSTHVLVDYNRSGNPLVEVVTDPDMESPEEAREFMNELITILGYLKIFDLKKGIIKADANISIKESGYTRAEVKNITGFKDIERALKHEVERQKSEVKIGNKLKQETRAWDSELGTTSLLRTKETEDDYGYIFDPDLVKIELDSNFMSRIKKEMPELAVQKREKYITEYKLKPDDAEVISAELILAELFERVAEEIDPILAAKWLRREVIRVANYNKKELHELIIDERNLIDLLKFVETKKITETIAQKLLEELLVKPFNVKERIEKEKLGAVSDTGILEKFCKEAIAENPKAVDDFKKGSEKSLNFIVGQVMRKTGGKATPKEVNEIIKKLLS